MNGDVDTEKKGLVGRVTSLFLQPAWRRHMRAVCGVCIRCELAMKIRKQYFHGTQTRNPKKSKYPLQ